MVSGAVGGVGSIAVQLAKLAGATVIGLASAPNHELLASHGLRAGERRVLDAQADATLVTWTRSGS